MSEVDKEKQVQTEAQRKTAAVLDAGILPHSTNERDHAYALLSPAYNIQGGRMYAERIASFHTKNIILGLPAEITLGAQLGFESPSRKALRARMTEEKRDSVMTTVADHMIDYVDDAQKNIDALLQLDVATEGFAKTQPLGPLLSGDTRPEIQRAVAVLTRLYETQEYATQPTAQKSRMNADLIKDMKKDAIHDRIEEATHDLGIGEVRKEIIEALELETGRLNFWTDQLVGHPDQPAIRGDADDADEFKRVRTHKRYGVVEAGSPELRNRIFERLTAIARGEYSNDK